MNIGVGLPNAVPGVDAATLLEWAQRADEGPFSSLGVVDRVGWECYEPLATLAAAASVTRRIALATTIVIGPLRDTTTLAREAASVDALSGGRLILGLAVGARREDYDLAGVPASERGRRLTEQLVQLRDAWDGDGFGPSPVQPGGPDLLVGGTSDIAFARMARHADGYVHGGGPPRLFLRAAQTAHAAWIDAGRPGMPQLWAQGYFALGDRDVVARGLDFMRAYYAFTGPFAERIAEGLLRTPQGVMQFVRGYQEAGCDELVLMPAVAGLDQLDRLADILAGL